MHLKKVLAIGIVSTSLFTSSVFGAVEAAKSKDEGIKIEQQKKENEGLKSKEFKKRNLKRYKEFKKEFERDPIKALEKKKEEIRSLEKEGKITKDKADAINSKIDKKINAIKEFNKLTPEQKRERLTEKFKSFTERRVKEGKMTKEDADKLIKEFKEDVKKYDGKSYPKFIKKYIKPKTNSAVREDKE